MKYRLLDLLCCPSCGDQLKLYPFEERENEIGNLEQRINAPRCQFHCGLKNIALIASNASHVMHNFDCIACYKKEIVEGVLSCDCGNLFPIINSVPRLLYGNLKAFPHFIAKYQDKLMSLTKES